MLRFPFVLRAALASVALGAARAGAQQPPPPPPPPPPPAAELAYDRAIASLAAGRAGAAAAIPLFQEDAAQRESSGDAAGAADAYRGVARAYGLLEQPDSVLRYVGKAIARDTASGDSTARRVAGLLTASPALHPSRSLTDEARFIRSVRALLSRLPGGDLLARRVGSVSQAQASLESISEQHKARVQIVGDVPGVEVSVIRYALRASPGILPVVLQTDTVVFLPAVAYQFRYRLASGRDTVVSRPCAMDCQVRIVRGGAR